MRFTVLNVLARIPFGGGVGVWYMTIRCYSLRGEFIIVESEHLPYFLGISKQHLPDI